MASPGYALSNEHITTRYAILIDAGPGPGHPPEMDARIPGAASGSKDEPRFTTLTLDRRRFLVLVAGAAAGLALAPELTRAARRVAAVAGPGWTLPDAAPAGSLDTARALIGAAILAPSYWNAQPWRFAVDADELRLALDLDRTLPASDPDRRFTLQSLGGALENLLVAARAWGLRPSVQYLPWGTSARPGVSLVAARVRWESGDQRRDRPMFAALTQRRSNPRRFDGRALTLSERAQLQAQVPEELGLHWIEDRATIRQVAGVVHDATELRARDTVSQRERMRWLRPGDREARRSGDGVTPERLGLSGPMGWLASRGLHPGSRGYTWGTSSLAHEAEDAVRSSGALALVTGPGAHEATCLLAGQAYERLALKATALGLAQQPLSAPIESERHRAELAHRFGASGEEPLLLVRFGHARPPAATPRRGVALVTSYHTS